MRAGFIEAPGVAYYKDVEEPQLLKPTDVKIRVKVTGICGSEVHAYHGKHAWRVPPLVSGHELAGAVCELGSAVTKYKIGDRVTAEPQYGCGHCELCKAGKYNLCQEKKILGAYYWSGSFGEYIVVPEGCVIPLGEKVTMDEGALIEPLAVGMHAVREHKVGENSVIAIIGCGTIGLGVLLSAKRFNPKKIIAIDVVDFNLEKAGEMGADLTLNSAKDPVLERVLAETDGYGVDITFLAFGNAACVQQASEITRRGGVISQIAVMANVSAPFDLIQIKEQKLCGSNMYTADDFKAVIESIDKGEIKLHGFITKRFPIEEFGAAMEWADKRPMPLVKVVLDF